MSAPHIAPQLRVSAANPTLAKGMSKKPMFSALFSNVRIPLRARSEGMVNSHIIQNPSACPTSGTWLVTLNASAPPTRPSATAWISKTRRRPVFITLRRSRANSVVTRSISFSSGVGSVRKPSYSRHSARTLGGLSSKS